MTEEIALECSKRPDRQREDLDGEQIPEAISLSLNNDCVSSANCVYSN